MFGGGGGGWGGGGGVIFKTLRPGKHLRKKKRESVCVFVYVYKIE